MSDKNLFFINGKLAKVEFLPIDIDFSTYQKNLANAALDGIKLFRKSNGDTFATSASQPGTIYQVSLENGCECAGFQNRGNCKHIALLLHELVGSPSSVTTNKPAYPGYLS